MGLPGGSVTKRNTLADAYSGRRNSLNLLRLVLATTVVLSHSISLGGYGTENFLHWSTAGTLAVYGFFGISGFLITQSALHHRPGRYLWHRFLRIFPAFWVCLIVTALVFGWLGWIHSGHSCGFSCYLKEPNGPLRYIFHNGWLRIDQLSIAGTLRGVPFLPVWNGSLWTLFYEFICYLLIGLLAVVGLLRRSWVVVVLGVLVWMAEFVIMAVPKFNAHINAFHHSDEAKLVALVPVFLTGSALYLFRDKVPDSGWIAIGCVAVFACSILLPIGNGTPAYTLTRADAFAPLLAYPLLWLGAHLPWPWIASRNDYSYGVYIYAFPAGQLLAIWGVYRWGYVPYTLMTALLVAPLAAASWWLIEKRALSLKGLQRKTHQSEIVAET